MSCSPNLATEEGPERSAGKKNLKEGPERRTRKKRPKEGRFEKTSRVFLLL